MIEVTMYEKTLPLPQESEEVAGNLQTNNSEELLDRAHDLKFNIGRSIRYHKARQNFFDLLDKFTNFISILFGSSSVFVLSQQNTVLAMYLGLSLAFISSLALVFGFSTKARDHFDFAKQFTEQERRLIKEPLSDGLLNSVEDEIRAIESNEPNVLRTLNDLCWNEEAESQGIPKEDLIEVHWYRRLFCHLF